MAMPAVLSDPERCKQMSLNARRKALEKFVDRRAVDAEGLYYLGRVLKQQGESEKARDYFEQAVDSAKTSPEFRRRSDTRHWSKLAKKEL